MGNVVAEAGYRAGIEHQALFEQFQVQEGPP
jgi:hypothetical protein